MARSTKPWIGKTDDTKAPPRVRQRVFDAHGGICHICDLPIKPAETWHLDHKTAIIAGGANAEPNLAPAHAHCNLAKGRRESAEKSKVAKVRGKHIGAIRPKQSIRSAPFAKAEKHPRIDKSAIKPLPPRQSLQERIMSAKATERFNFTAEIKVSKNGGWVHYSDYADATQHLIKARRIIRSLLE